MTQASVSNHPLPPNCHHLLFSPLSLTESMRPAAADLYPSLPVRLSPSPRTYDD